MKAWRASICLAVGVAAAAGVLGCHESGSADPRPMATASDDELSILPEDAGRNVRVCLPRGTPSSGSPRIDHMDTYEWKLDDRWHSRLGVVRFERTFAEEHTAPTACVLVDDVRNDVRISAELTPMTEDRGARYRVHVSVLAPARVLDGSTSVHPRADLAWEIFTGKRGNGVKNVLRRNVFDPEWRGNWIRIDDSGFQGSE